MLATDDEIDLLIAEREVELGERIQPSFDDLVGLLDLGLDVEIDISAACSVIRSRAEQEDSAPRAKVPPEYRPEGCALVLGESHA